jgi:hypothetical protein
LTRALIVLSVCRMRKQSDLGELARRAIADGLDLDAFVAAARAAYVGARPGMREQLEEQKVIAGLAEMRKRGLVGRA